MPIGCYKCYSYYPISNYNFNGKCGIGSCGNNTNHYHILCHRCEEHIRICYKCKATTVTALHYFYKGCGIKDCTKKGSHKYYLCKSCKKKLGVGKKGV